MSSESRGSLLDLSAFKSVSSTGSDFFGSMYGSSSFRTILPAGSALLLFVQALAVI